MRIQNDLAGPGATSRVTGAYFADGEQHLDYDTFQEHIAPNTTSDFAFKGALRDSASAVWRGMIRVEEDAQKTNAYQENRNLLLSKSAHADSIPGLEILANDVRCTHGATLGQVDREQLFYLMARGLSRAEAERLIVRGFFQDVLDRIELEPVREALASGARGPHPPGLGSRGSTRTVRLAEPSGSELRNQSGRLRFVLIDGNPFVYSRPVAPEDVIDRDEETEQLLRLAIGGHYVRLYAPRKFGKTSLLGRVLRDGEREGPVPVLVDLYGVLSIADVTVRIERAYAAQLKGSLRSRIDAFLKSTGLGLSLGAFGVSATLHSQPRTDPLPALHALLDLPLRLEAGGGYRALVVFDEFQDIGKVQSLDAILRSHVQYQGEVASYVFSGSEPGMMRTLFERKDRPLYGSAVPMRLERLRDADIAPYVLERFGQTGRDAGDAIGPLLRAAEGHPQRAIHLAHRLWAEVADGETRRASGTGRRPRCRRCSSCTRSSTATGARSPPPSRRRSARSWPARARRSRATSCGGSRSTRRPRTTRSSA